MKFRSLSVVVLFIVLSAGVVHASVDNYVSDLNIYASKKFGDFRAEISARYGISSTHFEKLLRKVDSPGDLAVSLWVGYKAQKSIDEVIRQYRIRRGQGWGVIAKESGIKPGSKDFKALKSGELGWYPKNFDEVMKRGKYAEVEVEVDDEAAERERKINERLRQKEKKRKAKKEKNSSQ